MLSERFKPTRKQMIVTASIATVILVAVVATVSYRSIRPAARPAKNAQAGKVSQAPPKPEAFDRLSGLPTTAVLAARRPIAVTIENYDPDSRPQSGFDRASIVYETIAEGGITRFMAVYTSGDAKVVGPIRSTREYFVYWAKGLDAIYVHCGGSQFGLDAIPELQIADIDELKSDPGFWRSSDRYAPHNLYSSTEKLRATSQKKGYPTDLGTPGYTFKEDQPLALRPARQSVSIDFWQAGAGYRASYVYRRDTNDYLRNMGGEAHVDAVSSKQLIAKNIAVVYTNFWRYNDYEDQTHIDTEGSGKAEVILDGTVTPATWRKSTPEDLLRFYDTAGKEIALNPGQTWIEVTDRPLIAE